MLRYLIFEVLPFKLGEHWLRETLTGQEQNRVQKQRNIWASSITEVALQIIQ